MKSLAELSALKIAQFSKKKKGGINCQLTELRDEASKLLGVTIGQIGKLTKGWKASDLYQLNYKAKQFKPNPPALWWKLYKQEKTKYGKKDSKTDTRSKGILFNLRKDGRKNKQEEGQGILF